MAFDAELLLKKPDSDFYKYIFEPKFIDKPTPIGLRPGCQCRLCNPAQFQRELETDVLTILKTARSLLNEGWYQRGMYAPNLSGVCSMAAILAAMQGVRSLRQLPGGAMYDGPSLEGRLDAIARYLPGMNCISDVIQFNDFALRTKGEVLALFDAGIARLERTAVPVTQPF
jgi:hypothetical protein